MEQSGDTVSGDGGLVKPGQIDHTIARGSAVEVAFSKNSPPESETAAPRHEDTLDARRQLSATQYHKLSSENEAMSHHAEFCAVAKQTNVSLLLSLPLPLPS